MNQTQVPEILEISLEKKIEINLVQANVTDQVLAALKEKYGGMKLLSLNDKESYLELKVAAKECAKVRTLTVKICKEGRESAVKEQKLWIAKEKEVVGQVAVVEDALDAEIKKFDDEVNRLDAEEKTRQEGVYINRQASLIKMGAAYVNGSFILGDAEFEANLIKGSSQNVWDEAVLPKFEAEYQKIEAVKIEEQRLKDEVSKELKRQQEELAKSLAELKKQQDEMQRQKNESENIEIERRRSLQDKRLQILIPHNPYSHGSIAINALWSLSEDQFIETVVLVKEHNEKAIAEKQKLADEKRSSDIEEAKLEAIAKERERAEAIRQQQRLEEFEKEQKEQAEFDASKDKVKWASFIQSVSKIESFDMRSSQYRKKMLTAKSLIEQIINS
jgi:hypothetical protein